MARTFKEVRLSRSSFEAGSQSGFGLHKLSFLFGEALYGGSGIVRAEHGLTSRNAAIGCLWEPVGLKVLGFLGLGT